MLISEAINIAESWLDYAAQDSNNDDLIAAVDRLIESGIHELGLQYKVEELTAEINYLENRIDQLEAKHE